MAASRQATSASSDNNWIDNITANRLCHGHTKQKGTQKLRTAVIPSAVRGRKAREEIIVATILLESRIPLMNSNTSARIITRSSPFEINSMLSFLYHDICNDVRRLVAAICRIRQVAVYLAQFQHLNHMMHILRSAEQICYRFTIDHLDTVFQRLRALGMVQRNIWVLRQAQNPLPDLKAASFSRDAILCMKGVGFTLRMTISTTVVSA
jgi:hypothetical protein